jgi:GNAT superfamily N-acetyltransferase
MNFPFNFELRRVVESDLSMLRRHRNEFSTRKWLESESTISAEAQLQWFNEARHKCHLVLHCQEFGALGLARLKPLGCGWVQVGMDLFSAYRGKGLSSRCFSLVIDEASLLGDKLELWVFLDNLPAVKLYKKFGFLRDEATEVRRLARLWAPDGQKFPYVRMIKK